MSGIRFPKEFGNIDKFSIEFGCRIIANFEYPFTLGRIAVFDFFQNLNLFRNHLSLEGIEGKFRINYFMINYLQVAIIV